MRRATSRPFTHQRHSPPLQKLLESWNYDRYENYGPIYYECLLNDIPPMPITMTPQRLSIFSWNTRGDVGKSTRRLDGGIPQNQSVRTTDISLWYLISHDKSLELPEFFTYFYNYPIFLLHINISGNIQLFFEWLRFDVVVGELIQFQCIYQLVMGML